MLKKKIMDVSKLKEVESLVKKLLINKKEATAQKITLVQYKGNKSQSQLKKEHFYIENIFSLLSANEIEGIKKCLDIARYIFQGTQLVCYISITTIILRCKIVSEICISQFAIASFIITKLNVHTQPLEITQANPEHISYNSEEKIGPMCKSKTKSDNEHINYKDKLRDFGKEGEVEMMMNKFEGCDECEITSRKGCDDSMDIKKSDQGKHSTSQQTEFLCNLGGSILDHHGVHIKPQTWHVYIQNTAVFNPQNPTDVRGIPWAWLREEKWRLQTFAKYPLNAKKSAILLAEDGFVYIGSGKDSDDTVICFHCRIVKQNWLEDEDIKATHRAMSPTCAMVMGTQGSNIPLVASTSVSFGRPQHSTNGNFIDIDCPHQSNQGASNKPSGSVQLATQSVMAPQAPKPQLSQPPCETNRAGLSQASDLDVSSTVVTSSDMVPSLPGAEGGRRQSQGSQQPEQVPSPPTQQQGTASDSRQGNPSLLRTGSDSGRTVSDGGNRTPRTNAPSAPTALPAEHSASPTSPQSSTSSPQTPSSAITATSQSSVPTSVTQSTSATPVAQPSTPSRAAQALPVTSTTQPITPAGATQPTTPATQPPAPAPATQPTTPATQPPATAPTNQPSTQTPAQPDASRNPTYVELGIITERPKRYEYAVRVKRLETFGDWPSDHHLRKEDLADAGYYYAGYGDCARCFYCGGGLRNWEQDDDVWVEHARWFPKCAFIRQRLGQVFINTVAHLAQTKDKISFMEVVAEMKIDPSAFQIDSKETPLKNDAAVLAVKQMGYDEKDILPTAASIKETGQMLSADILFTALEEKRVPRMNVRTELKANSPSMSVNRDQAKDEELLHSLKQTNNDLRLQTMCKICMDKEVAVVFLPCGHLVCCTECAAAMKDCPVCRNQVKGVVRAFMG